MDAARTRCLGCPRRIVRHSVKKIPAHTCARGFSCYTLHMDEATKTQILITLYEMVSTSYTDGRLMLEAAQTEADFEIVKLHIIKARAIADAAAVIEGMK